MPSKSKKRDDPYFTRPAGTPPIRPIPPPELEPFLGVPAWWKNEYYVTVYAMRRRGVTLAEVAAELGVSVERLQARAKRDPALQDAWKRGKIRPGPDDDKWTRFVYHRLDPILRPLWNKLTERDDLGQLVYHPADLFAGRTDWSRKAIYLHAFLHCDFNATEAAGMVAATPEDIRQWCKDDQQFADRLYGLPEVKKDFFESHLIKAVKGGEVSAITFANRTQNKDRGYGVDKSTVEHKHSGAVGTFSLDVIFNRISAGAQMEILAAARAIEAESKEPPRLVNVLPAHGDDA